MNTANFRALALALLAPALLAPALFAPALLADAQQSNARPPITGISHIAVYSTDAAKTDTFYATDLGAVKAADPESPQGARFYFSKAQFVEVLPLPQASSVNRLDHVAFTTTDADALRRYMAAHAVAVPNSVQSAPDGSRWFEVRDPEGNRVQFVQPPATPPQVPLDPLSHRIIHVGYLVHSRAAEDPFYRDVLGFRPYWHGGMKEGTTDWVSQQVPDGTDWIEYMLVPGPEKTGLPADMTVDRLGVLDHFSLGVHDIKHAVEVLHTGDRLPARASGPQIGRDGKWQYNVFSPDGTRAEFMEFQPVLKPCCSAFTAASPTD